MRTPALSGSMSLTKVAPRSEIEAEAPAALVMVKSVASCPSKDPKASELIRPGAGMALPHSGRLAGFAVYIVA